MVGSSGGCLLGQTGGLPELHEAGHDVNGDGEDNGAIVLRRDPIQRLQIP